jgi:hypothetical protein
LKFLHCSHVFSVILICASWRARVFNNAVHLVKYVKDILPGLGLHTSVDDVLLQLLGRWPGDLFKPTDDLSRLLCYNVK